MSVPEPLVQVHLASLAYTALHWVESWRQPDDGHAPTFDLDAPYQRGSVWSVEQRQNLIKSLMMGLPTGNIVVSKLPYRDVTVSPYRIVDGKQRIEALRAFYADDFGVPAWWFDSRDLNEPELREDPEALVTYSQLSQRGQRVLYNSHMSALEFQPGTVMTENMEFDESLVDPHRGKPLPGYEDDPRTRRWNTYYRTDEEILQAEADLYLLVNFGGVEQTEADRERATKIAGR